MKIRKAGASSMQTGIYVVRQLLSLSICSSVIFAVGCFSSDATFSLNMVHLRKQEKIFGEPLQPKHQDDLSDILIGIFGTPDEPNVPLVDELDATATISSDLLKLAAGPVASDEFGNATGLYREHCAHCHGVTGDGLGPTAAFLNPYPRDYRRGTFKFKSTPIGTTPTHDDLKRVIVNGIADTAMPAFKLLPDAEVEALVHYVKYLAIRGEVERLLMEQLLEVSESERLVSYEKSEEDDSFVLDMARIRGIVKDVLRKWERADSQVTEVPALADSWSNDQHEEAAKLGRELFYGKFGCTKCHGDAALGDGELGNYDKWTDEWTKEMIPPIKPTDHSAISEFLKLGALQPRPIRPRNLRMGVYRGGNRPVDLYWRVMNGIDGTPMPAAPGGTTPKEIWAVVMYVRSLPFEPISQPPEDKVVNQEGVKP